MNHIGGNAELYALGALEDNERLQIEDHARNCLPCAKLLGNAERIVADIESELPAIDPPPHLEERIMKSVRMREKARLRRPARFWGSLAAVLLLGFVTTVLGLRLWYADQQIHQNDMILTALSDSEYGHLSFRPQPTADPIARALCEKHGAWIYLILTRANSHLTLYGDRNGNRERLGHPVVSQGRLASLFIENPGKFAALELVENGRVVAREKTRYPR